MEALKMKKSSIDLETALYQKPQYSPKWRQRFNLEEIIEMQKPFKDYLQALPSTDLKKVIIDIIQGTKKRPHEHLFLIK